ncbi:Cytosolic carboxypeptidase-like protein 5 [Taenia crassiceps]|uniref:Cytosolic carboxypeptidase-like protein 5 n=1 Tax=Taenia crassiceps TaxID=6207 RepID=A0ABR4QLJ9_9CEST
MQVGVLLFSANFDSGNLGQVENVQESIEFTGPQSGKTQTQSWADRLVTINGAERRPLLCSKPDYHVKCWTYPDAHGTPFENGNKSWFHFSVRNYAPGSVIRISIMNVNHQSKIFNQGYTPVYNVMSSVTDDACYPWTYLDTQLQLRRLEDLFAVTMPIVKSIQVTPDPIKATSSIYLHRELLCYSLCGRRIDLLTISDNTNKLSELEDRFDPLLFPEQSIPRPHKFAKKKVFLITARVHPGETPGSHMFNGLLEFLLRERDERAIQLRRTYVFKLIPMLNPDGVAMGHHRTDSRGANLNRFYLQPNFLLYPSVYAVKALATYHHLSYSGIARYPGCLSPRQFQRFVEFAARYRSFATSAEVSPHTGNLVRPPFVPKRKESLSASAVSLKGKTLDAAAELTCTLRAALKGKRSVSFGCTKSRKSYKQQLSSCQHPLTLMDARISKQNEESDDAGRSPSPQTKSDNVVRYVTSKKLVGDGEDQQEPIPNTWCAGSVSKCVQPMLRVQAIRRRKNSVELNGSGNSDFIKEASEGVQKCRPISNQVPEKSQSGKDDYDAAHSDHLPLPPQPEKCRPQSDSSPNLLQKASKPTTSTDDEHEADSRRRKLDRVYVNMVAQYLKQDGQEMEAKEAFLAYCTGAHLTHPNLLSTRPEESGVKCYIDLHGHCTKRGCFCYGNRLKDTRQMVDIVLYARLVATNSAFFDFSACNFSLRNMYLRDKVNDTTKEGSGRVGIWKHTGITHCYTVEANYTSSRVLNILSATLTDDRCATPPGTLWGPLRGSTVVPKPPPVEVTSASSFFTNPISVTSTTTDALVGNATHLAKLTEHGSYVISHDERYTPAHFQEMGRGLLTAALDMWSVNPWSRLATSACADMVRFRPGTYCSLKSLLNNAPRFGKLGPVRSGGHVPTKLRQAELANMKVLRNWAKNFVGNTATNESSEALKASTSPRTHPVSQASAHVSITSAVTTAISGRRREHQLHRQRLPVCPPAAVADFGVVESRPVVKAVVPVSVSEDGLWNAILPGVTSSNVAMERRVCSIGDSGSSTNRLLALPEEHERTKQLPSPSMPAAQPTDRCVAVVKSISKHQIPIPHPRRRTKSIELVLSVKGRINSTITACSLPIARLRIGKRVAKRDSAARFGRVLSRSNSNEHKLRPIKLIRKRVSLTAPMHPPNRSISKMAHPISTTAVLRPPPNGITPSSVAALEAPTFVPLRPRLRRTKRPRRTKDHREKGEVLPRLINFAPPAVHHKEALTASGQ